MLDMMGYGENPLILKESKVIEGQSEHPRGKNTHPNMTAEIWKKLPDWIENPAAVFVSKTVSTRFVFVAPEIINGTFVSIVIEPNVKEGNFDVNLLFNAYDGKDISNLQSWAKEGLTRYVNNELIQQILGTSRLQLPRVNQGAGSIKILTENNLKGYSGWVVQGLSLH
jgi:hypothetical protein